MEHEKTPWLRRRAWWSCVRGPQAMWKVPLLLVATTLMPAQADEPVDPDKSEQVARSQQQTAVEVSTRQIAGWTVHVNKRLLEQDAAATAKALELLQVQLQEITRVVPVTAVKQLQVVPLWLSPEYPGVRPRAEYHPNADWLRKHDRNPAMVKSVEFTNIRIFEAEVRRMPNFALHELAHAYHDRVLGNDHPDIIAAYKKAKASGKYNRVEQRFGDGRKAFVRAYAITNPREYFAESTEAYFVRNDFYPFTPQQLKKHDPEMFELVDRLWGCDDSKSGDE